MNKRKKSRSRGRRRESASRRAIERSTLPRYFGHGNELTTDDLLLIRQAVLANWNIAADVKCAIVDGVQKTALSECGVPAGVQILAINVFFHFHRQNWLAIERGKIRPQRKSELRWTTAVASPGFKSVE